MQRGKKKVTYTAAHHNGQKERMMNDISNLTPQQKSVMLARLAGYQVLNTMCGEARRVFCDPNGYQIGGSIDYKVAKHLSKDEEFCGLCPDFYNPANMALLATAIAWFSGVTHWEPHVGSWAKWVQHTTDGMNLLRLHEWMCKSADAGLMLAIEAGLTTLLLT